MLQIPALGGVEFGCQRTEQLLWPRRHCGVVRSGRFPPDRQPVYDKNYLILLRRPERQRRGGGLASQPGADSTEQRRIRSHLSGFQDRQSVARRMPVIARIIGLVQLLPGLGYDRDQAVLSSRQRMMGTASSQYSSGLLPAQRLR